MDTPAVVSYAILAIICSHATNFADINECNINNGGCNHFCTDNDGSFLCSCRPGFTLSQDERTCTGTCTLLLCVMMAIFWTESLDLACNPIFSEYYSGLSIG